MKLAAVTMVYNEPDYMDIWCRYYGKQVGLENCYVIDHGTEDGTTDHLGAVNVTRIPRSPKDNVARAKLVSDVCADLLTRYDAVVHADVDELLVPDPRYHRNLKDCVVAMKGPVMHAIGLEVWHLAETEPAIDITQPVSLQRGWTWFNGALCKPALIREPVNWSPGFHSVDAALAFDHLFLFHLRYFDVQRGLQRLARTRSMAWADEHSGQHQRQPDEKWLKLVRDVGRLPKAQVTDIDVDREPLEPLLAKVIESQKGRETKTYKIDMGIQGRVLMPLPLRFKGRF